MADTTDSHPFRRWKTNALALAHILADALPRALVTRDAYRRLRGRLSRQPARFQSSPRVIPSTRDAPGAPPSWRGRKLVTKDTDLVIEGFPGSANSFVANAVRAAIDQPANVESHFHHGVQLTRAVAFGVPTVVLVRPPRDACRSLKTKSPNLVDALIVLRWLHYHRAVLRHLDRPGFDAVLFDEVIRDVDVVRRRSEGVQRLVARPLVADGAMQRASREHAPFGGGRFVEWLLRVADRMYRRIAGRGGSGELGR